MDAFPGMAFLLSERWLLAGSSLVHLLSGRASVMEPGLAAKGSGRLLGPVFHAVPSTPPPQGSARRVSSVRHTLLGNFL